MATIRRALKTMPYAQAQVIIFGDGDRYLRSYKTIVAGVEDGWVICNGTYSPTTKRHLDAFAKELNPAFTWRTLAQLYREDLRMNLETGEVEPRVHV